MTKRIFAAAALLAAILFPACSDQPGAAAGEPDSRAETAARGPALWTVSDRDTTIYLFGTIHLLPGGLQWMTPTIARAFDESDTLVLETLGVTEPAKVQPVIAELGYSPNEPPLAERVAAEDRDELATAIAEAGVPAAALDAMETWLATMTLSTARIVTLGYGLDSGVESQLTARAQASGMRMEGLETIREQLSFFDTLPEAEQRTLLKESLDDLDEIRATVDETVAAWAKGDVEAVATAMEEDVQSSPVLAKRLLADRNANWARWIAARLKTPGTVFVAVGTGHLAGDESVQKMLASKGIAAKRVS
jgi:uncharacterized protein YbaP (TraB family)